MILMAFGFGGFIGASLMLLVNYLSYRMRDRERKYAIKNFRLYGNFQELKEYQQVNINRLLDKMIN